MKKQIMKKWLASGMAICLLATTFIGFPGVSNTGINNVAASAATSEGLITYTIADNIANIKLLGRTSVRENNLQNGLDLDWSTSGVAFNMEASQATDIVFGFKMKSYSSFDPSMYFTVYVDGKQLTDKRYGFTPSKAQLKIEGVSAGKHLIEIFKQTENKHGECSLFTISMNGVFGAKPKDKGLKIEIIGDSVTAGYGNLGNSSIRTDEQGGSPKYEDAMQTFGAILAQDLNADVSILGMSGIGVSCANPDKARDYIMPDYYEYVNYARYKPQYFSGEWMKWNFGTGADIVVVNLGANDWNRHVSGGKWNDNSKCGITYSDVGEHILDFLKTVRKKNPNAQIVWTYGMTGYACRDKVQMAVNTLKNSGDTKVSYLDLNSGGAAGANGHPSVAEHQLAAEHLLQHLTTLDANVAKEEVAKGVVKINTTMSNDFLISKFNKNLVPNVPLQVAVNLPTNQLINQIKSKGIKDVELTINIPNSVSDNSFAKLSNMILKEDVLSALKSKGANLTVLVKNNSGKLLFSWNIKGSDLKNATNPISDINLVLNLINSNDDENIKKITSKDTKNKDTYILKLSNENFLPSQSKIKFYVGSTTKLSGKVNVLRLNMETGKYEAIPYGSSYSVDSEGYLTLDILYYADYVIVKNAPDSKITVSLLNQITAQDNVTLNIGGSRQISVKLPEGFEKVDSLKSAASSSKVVKAVMSYATDNSKVITLTKTGIFSGKKVGKATITTTVLLSTGEKKIIKTVVTVKK